MEKEVQHCRRNFIHPLIGKRVRTMRVGGAGSSVGLQQSHLILDIFISLFLLSLLSSKPGAVFGCLLH